MMVLVTLTIEQNDCPVLEMEAWAGVTIEQVSGEVEWDIEAYYIDRSDQSHLGIHNFEPIEDEQVIKLLSTHEEYFDDQIGQAVHQIIGEAA